MEYKYRCKILRVVDGDTVDIDVDLGFGVWLHRERVRLQGIDTPESRTRDLTEKKFGLASKAKLKDLLPIGSMQILVCKEYDSKGKFGRILGDFEYESTTVCETMISEGYAVPYFGGSKEELEQMHLQNRERLIKEEKIVL